MFPTETKLYTLENAEFTRKLRKEIVYCYKVIPIQEIGESWSLPSKNSRSCSPPPPTTQ